MKTLKSELPEGVELEAYPAVTGLKEISQRCVPVGHCGEKPAVIMVRLALVFRYVFTVFCILFFFILSYPIVTPCWSYEPLV